MFVVLQEFINIFFEKAGALHNKIGEYAGKDSIPDLNSDLLALRNFVEGTLAIPNSILEIVDKIVQSLFAYYELIATRGSGNNLRNMSADQSDDYIREFEKRKTEPVEIQRKLLHVLRNFILMNIVKVLFFASGKTGLAEPKLYKVKYNGLYLAWRFSEFYAML